MNCMKENNKWYWEQAQTQNNIIVKTRTIVHICLDAMIVTGAKKILKSVLKRNQEHQGIQRNPICITDSNYDFILDQIKRTDTIEYKRYISIDDKEAQFTECLLKIQNLKFFLLLLNIFYCL